MERILPEVAYESYLWHSGARGPDISPGWYEKYDIFKWKEKNINCNHSTVISR